MQSTFLLCNQEPHSMFTEMRNACEKKNFPTFFSSRHHHCRLLRYLIVITSHPLQTCTSSFLSFTVILQISSTHDFYRHASKDMWVWVCLTRLQQFIVHHEHVRGWLIINHLGVNITSLAFESKIFDQSFLLTFASNETKTEMRKWVSVSIAIKMGGKLDRLSSDYSLICQKTFTSFTLRFCLTFDEEEAEKMKWKWWWKKSIRERF